EGFMPFFRFIIMLLLAIPAFAEESVGDAVVEANQISEKVAKHFYAREFKAISALDEELRTSKEKQRLSDGRWSVTFLYEQLRYSSYNNKSHDEWMIKDKIAYEWLAKMPDHPAPH